ncbi:hypothetical protein JKP88DRAFT_289516 [Tribonema minus]|uniref:Cyclin N-terminal domain-containing protein n=1 Tax=Tribonema minus TaxID=303371 RepID=A0A835Z161_9STRA|nr:hypothetical protein JKP88DRAFT_289516 [Tribonema minus]
MINSASAMSRKQQRQQQLQRKKQRSILNTPAAVPELIIKVWHNLAAQQLLPKAGWSLCRDLNPIRPDTVVSLDPTITIPFANRILSNPSVRFLEIRGKFEDAKCRKTRSTGPITLPPGLRSLVLISFHGQLDWETHAASLKSCFREFYTTGDQHPFIAKVAAYSSTRTRGGFEMRAIEARYSTRCYLSGDDEQQRRFMEIDWLHMIATAKKVHVSTHHRAIHIFECHCSVNSVDGDDLRLVSSAALRTAMKICEGKAFSAASWNLFVRQGHTSQQMEEMEAVIEKMPFRIRAPTMWTFLSRAVKSIRRLKAPTVALHRLYYYIQRSFACQVFLQFDRATVVKGLLCMSLAKSGFERGETSDIALCKCCRLMALVLKKCIDVQMRDSVHQVYATDVYSRVALELPPFLCPAYKPK